MRSTRFSAWHWGLFGLIALAGPGVATADAATLRWKFRPNETLRYAIETRTVLSDKFANGQELKTTTTQAVEMSWAVRSVNADGSAEMTLTIDRVADKVDGPRGKIEFDSKSGQEPQGAIAGSLANLYKSVIGQAIPFRLSARGEPSGLKVPEKMADSLRQAGPAAAASSPLFSEEGLRNLIGLTTLVVPQEDLAAGKTWNHEEKQTAPDGTTLTLATTYTYQGTEAVAGRPADAIAQATRIDIVPPAQAKDQFPLKIKAQDSRGVTHFDNEAGRLIDARVVTKIDQSLSLNGLEMPQSRETTNTVRLLAAGAGG